MKYRVVLVFAMLALAGCSTTGLGSNSTGVATGGAASNDTRLGTTVISAMGGGLVSGSIGAGLTEREKRSGLEAEYKALEYTTSGQPVAWKGDQADHYGEVIAAQPYRVGSQDCRQYKHTVVSAGPAQTARGTACRNADGSWTPLT